MSWMKYVADIQRSTDATDNLRRAIQSAEKYNLNHVIFDGQLMRTEKLKAMLTIIEKSNDSIHREPDSDFDGQQDTDGYN